MLRCLKLYQSWQHYTVIVSCWFNRSTTKSPQFYLSWIGFLSILFSYFPKEILQWNVLLVEIYLQQSHQGLLYNRRSSNIIIIDIILVIIITVINLQYIEWRNSNSSRCYESRCFCFFGDEYIVNIDWNRFNSSTNKRAIILYFKHSTFLSLYFINSISHFH